MTIKTLIVDDEPLARLNLRKSIDKKTNWKIVGELGSGSGLSDLIKETSPEVLFLDIEMPEENGLSIAKRILSLEKCPIIIFVTAYNEYAIDAFEVCAFDYILKPFNNERFFACLERVENLINNSKTNLISYQKNQLKNFNNLKRIIIRSLGNIEIINVEHINYIKASGNYAELFHKNGTSLQRTTLNFLENRLNGNDFVRIHRSTIVRIDLINKIEMMDDHINYLTLNNTTEKFKLSATYKPALYAALGID